MLLSVVPQFSTFPRTRSCFSVVLGVVSVSVENSVTNVGPCVTVHSGSLHRQASAPEELISVPVHIPLPSLGPHPVFVSRSIATCAKLRPHPPQPQSPSTQGWLSAPAAPASGDSCKYSLHLLGPSARALSWGCTGGPVGKHMCLGFQQALSIS